MMRNSAVNGFFLIEIIIVVAITSLLASIAYPNYTNYVKRAARTDAMVILSISALDKRICPIKQFFSLSALLSFVIACYYCIKSP
jgi:prepilin-type N-terminal cleavage/methylation domain-containing protein